MGKMEQVSPPLRSLCAGVQGSLWVSWSATASRGRPPGTSTSRLPHGPSRVPAAPNLFVHPPADLRKVACSPSLVSPCASAPPPRRLPSVSSGDGVLHSRLRSPPSLSCLFPTFPRRLMTSVLKKLDRMHLMMPGTWLMGRPPWVRRPTRIVLSGGLVDTE